MEIENYLLKIVNSDNEGFPISYYLQICIILLFFMNFLIKKKILDFYFNNTPIKIVANTSRNWRLVAFPENTALKEDLKIYIWFIFNKL